MSRFPIGCRFTGEGFEIVAAHRRMARDNFEINKVYPMVVADEESSRSRRHYFACINEAYENLPPGFEGRFANADELRKHALIKTGYCHTRSLVCESVESAERVAAFARPPEEYAIVVTEGRTVTVLTPETQREGAMGHARFQKSKDDVLGLLADMLGVTQEQLTARGREAA